MTDAHLAQLESLLRRHGSLTAAALGTALDVSQPTISRLLTNAGDRIVRIGKARASRYALSRDIALAGNRWPLYRIGPDGRSDTLGELRALHGGGFHFEPTHPRPAFLHGDFANGLVSDLPWFLDDQRPQGFLGRAFAHRVAPSIDAPEDLAQWNADHIVLALLRHGDDALGDLVLGEASLQRTLQAMLSPHTLLPDERTTHYPALADKALAGENIGSSAGGEQPKFTALLRSDAGIQAVIVKFSEHAGTPAAQRWADLLRCEHIAGHTLRAHGIAAAETELLEADGRVFLQSLRFDRTPSLGRRGLVSLASLDAAYYGHGRIDWWRFAPQLRRDGWLDAAAARRLAICGWFGALIGNNDMHLGNASLVLTDTRPLALTPGYDMLPMALRPVSTGEVVTREIAVAVPLPEHFDDWQTAAKMACDFWRRVMGEAAISDTFHAIAEVQLKKLETARVRFA